MTQLPRSVNCDPVAVPPDAGVVLEVGGAVAGAVGVVPEADRHRRHRAPDHELAELPDDRPAVEIEGDGVHAEARRGDLARVDGEDRIRRHEPGADVRAAAADVEEEVGAELLVEPGVALGRERRPGLGDGADRREVEAAPRLEPVLAARHRERGAQPHERRAGLLGEPPLERDVGVAGVAVDQQDRRAEDEVRDERVPHHPRGRREPEHPVAAVDVEAEPEVLAVLEEDAAVPVDDRLRQPGRAGGEEHVQRVGERDGVELERPRLGEELVPAERVRAARRRGRPRTGRGRRARATAAPRGPRPPARGGRRPCRRSGSRRSRGGPSARAGPAGRGRCAARTRRRRSPRSRRGWRWRGTRRASRGCSAGTRRPGRPGRRRAAAAPRAPAPPARAARRRSARTGRASASGRGPRPCRGPRRARAACSA